MLGPDCRPNAKADLQTLETSKHRVIWFTLDGEAYTTVILPQGKASWDRKEWFLLSKKTDNRGSPDAVFKGFYCHSKYNESASQKKNLENEVKREKNTHNPTI